MNPTKMKIIIPPDFITACEVLGLQPQAALQLFVDYLSVYIYLPPACDQPQPVASAIFKSFIEALSRRNRILQSGSYK